MTLEDALERAAGVGRLLVVCDYDGTAAPLVDDPSLAFPDGDAIDALSQLARLESTAVVLLSGRSLTVLARLSGSPDGVELIGSHGAEATVGPPAVRSPDLGLALELFEELHTRFPGSRVEDKPLGVAFHYRTVDVAQRPAAAGAAEEIASRFSTLKSIHGKFVVELTAPGAGKGAAIERLRAQYAADAVVFLGDDVTDEDGFAALGPGDVGVKVGEGETAAGFRVDGTDAVPGILVTILRVRSRLQVDKHRPA